jgi:hypothetical protein
MAVATERLNHWMTFLANIAVLGGVIFLALEIQQNTNAIRATAIQESVNVARQQILLFATDPEINRLDVAEFDQLSDEDRRRVFWLRRSFWLGMDGLFRQRQLGVFPEVEWEMWLKIICSNYKTTEPEIWADNAATLPVDFVAVVESCSHSTTGVLP